MGPSSLKVKTTQTGVQASPATFRRRQISAAVAGSGGLVRSL
jgi:hypothetical protein